MAQFYFLSVLFNLLAGLIIVYGKKLTGETSLTVTEEDSDLSPDSDEKHSKVSDALGKFDSRSFRLVLGVLCMFVGLMKFLSVFRNDIPFIGDIVPALAGLAGGAALLIEYYSASASVNLELPAWANRIFIESRKYVGVFCLSAGLLHFICPQVMLL